MDLRNLSKNDTIIAPATAPGMGAIAVIRISGPDAIRLVDQHFESFKAGKSLLNAKTHTAHFGKIISPSRQTTQNSKLETQNSTKAVDEVLVNVFEHGKSFTGEETVEISCHGSVYITQEIVRLFIDAGCRAADAGEFTMRAYRNGKFDLSQAEAVADLIHSTSQASAQIALSQLKGGVSSEISKLREKLLNFASLIELELDFSEEDVEFADRTQFIELVSNIQNLVVKLMDSFALGNAIKNGIPVAIIGEPNVGKSTLLNALLEEDRAIVSDIAGTTRDTLEEELNINGVAYRFIDTAGIRETDDVIESKGIEKAYEKMEQAQVILRIFDLSTTTPTIILSEAKDLSTKHPNKKILVILNKVDLVNISRHPERGTTEGPSGNAEAKQNELASMLNQEENLNTSSILSEFKTQNSTFNIIAVSAKSKNGIEQIKEELSSLVDLGQLNTGDIIISNARHYNSLSNANDNLNNVLSAMQNGLPTDLLAIDIRAALHNLGEITGEITTDDLLGNIFSKFCIGK